MEQKDLIENFVIRLFTDTDLDEKWEACIQGREAELQAISVEENLKAKAAGKFIAAAFCDG